MQSLLLFQHFVSKERKAAYVAQIHLKT